MPYHHRLHKAYADVSLPSVAEIPVGTPLFRGGQSESRISEGFPPRKAFIWLSTSFKYAFDSTKFDAEKQWKQFRYVYKTSVKFDLILARVKTMYPIGIAFLDLKLDGQFQNWQRDNMVLLAREVLGKEIHGVYLSSDQDSDEILFDNANDELVNSVLYIEERNRCNLQSACEFLK